MVEIAHIVNPVKMDSCTDLKVAQPITFESMRIAQEYARKEVLVKLYSAQFKNDEDIIPGFFIRTPNLNRSILDFGSFKLPRKLPLICDILDRLYNHSNADFLIYSNVDIALQPYFYSSVHEFINQGYDALVINRRTIPDHYSSIDEIPLMYSEVGKKHPGFDCFVFHRKLYKKLDLGQICIGTTKIGVTIIANLICKATKFKLFDDLHLTFHIGEARDWQDDRYKEYAEHNEKEALQIMSSLRKRYTRQFESSDLCQKHIRMLKEKYILNK